MTSHPLHAPHPSAQAPHAEPTPTCGPAHPTAPFALPRPATQVLRDPAMKKKYDAGRYEEEAAV